MVRQGDSCGAIRHAVLTRLWDAMAEGVFFAWGYLLLANNNPFSLLSHDIFLPILFFVAMTIALGALSLAAAKAKGVVPASEERAAAQAYLCAAASSMLLGVAISCGLPPAATVLGASVLVAGSLFSFARLFFLRCCYVGPLDIAVEAAMAFASGIAIFLVSIVAFSGASVLFCYAIMLLFCGLGYARTSMRSYGKPSTSSERGGSAGFSRNGVRSPEAIHPAFFKVTFFLVGMLLAYEFNGTQKTMHFVGVHVDSAQIGGTAFVSFEYLLITAFFLALVVVAYTRFNLVPLAVATAVLVSVSFLSVPTPGLLPFPLLAAVATVFLFMLWFSLCPVLQAAATAQERAAVYFTALGFLSLGALTGSVTAFAVLALLGEEPLFTFFAGFQAAVLLAIVIVLIIFHRDVSVLLGRDSPAKTLDVSRLDDRCSMLAIRYGLTKRESEILGLLARGRNVPSVAEELSVSKSTVRSHVLQIYRKAGVNSRQELLDLIYGEGDLF